jgi:16S rRNA G527 N7-methylase RsmG
MLPLASRLVGKVSPLLFGLAKPYAAFQNAASNIGGLSDKQMESFHEYCKCLLASQRHKIDVASMEDSFFKPSELTEIPESFPYLNVLPHKHPEMIFDRHFADSLSIIPTLAKLSSGADKNVKIVDIGSGGGLPGIAIAIARPEWRVTLVDTVEKKCVFMRRVVEELGLPNVTVINSRAESLTYFVPPEAKGKASGKKDGADDDDDDNDDDESEEAARKRRVPKALRAQDAQHMREVFDIAISRGVASFDIASEFCLPFVRVGGHCVAMKTRSLSADQVAAPALPADKFAPFAADLRAARRIVLRQEELEAAAAVPWKPKPHSLPALAPLFRDELSEATEGRVAELGGGPVKFVYLDPVCEVNGRTGEEVGLLKNKTVAPLVEDWARKQAAKQAAGRAGKGPKAEGEDEEEEAAPAVAGGAARVGADVDVLLMHYLWVTEKVSETPEDFPRLNVKHKSKRVQTAEETEEAARLRKDRDR